MPTRELRDLLASERLLTRRWPRYAFDAMVLLTAIDVSDPSLADAVRTGLVSVMTPGRPQTSGLVTVVHRAAALTAIAFDSAGKQVARPHQRLASITKLQAIDLVVDGTSALRRTG